MVNDAKEKYMLVNTTGREGECVCCTWMNESESDEMTREMWERREEKKKIESTYSCKSHLQMTKLTTQAATLLRHLQR